ncbi:hypothetical protein Tco_1268133 [Tanacetum coccineum]
MLQSVKLTLKLLSVSVWLESKLMPWIMMFNLLLTSTVEEMDLFALIYHRCDPTQRLLIVERMKAIKKGKVPLLDSTVGLLIPLDGIKPFSFIRLKRRATGGASGSNHPPKKLRKDHDNSGNVSASTGRKSLAVIQDLFKCSTLNVEVGVATAATVPFITTSVTLTAEHKGGGDTDSIFGPNLRTQHLSKRFVNSSDSSYYSSVNAADEMESSLAI